PAQALLELGIPGGLALLAAFALGLALLVRRARTSPVEAGAAAAALALLVQNQVDFSLQFACGLVLLALLAGGTLVLRGDSEVAPLRMRRWFAVGALGIVFAGGAALAWPGLPADSAQL